MLTAQIAQADDKLRRLYEMVEDGLTDIDEVLGDRLAALKSVRDRAKAALERIKVQLAPEIALELDQIERFGAFMRERITAGETTFRKAYLLSIVDAIDVDDTVIRIHGSKASLEQAVIAGEQIGKGVRNFIRKWRGRRDSDPRPQPWRGVVVLARASRRRQTTIGRECWVPEGNRKQNLRDAQAIPRPTIA